MTTTFPAARCGAVLLLSALISAHAEQFRPPLAERIVTALDGREIQATVPIATDDEVEDLLFRVTEGLRLPVAIERSLAPADSHPRPSVTVRVTAKLTGRPLPDVLDAIVADTGFRWRYDGNVVHVTSLGDSKTFLDTVLSPLELHRSSLEAALAELHHRLDAGFSLETRPAPGR